jgi:hypothetical protein
LANIGQRAKPPKSINGENILPTVYSIPELHNTEFEETR